MDHSENMLPAQSYIMAPEETTVVLVRKLLFLVLNPTFFKVKFFWESSAHLQT